MKKVLFGILAIGFFTATSFAQNAKKENGLSIGDKIPSFSLPDQDGKVFKSSDFIGKNSLVIFFYPKDESLVCTKEACSFRDNYEAFQKAGAVVVGINGGSVLSHKNFQQKEKLPYRLLSDAGNKVIKLFNVPDKLFMTGRKTFIVDKSGKVVFTYDSSLKGSKHAEETLAFLKKLNN